jgi:hypothetical protein
MKLIYVILIVCVIVWMIYQISSRIISREKAQRQLNIITDNNNDVELSINVDKINDLKNKFFSTFQEEESLEITTADYVISFEKSLLNSIKIFKRGEEESKKQVSNTSEKQVVEKLSVSQKIDVLINENESISVENNSDEIEDFYAINADEENPYSIDLSDEKEGENEEQ